MLGVVTNPVRGPGGADHAGRGRRDGGRAHLPQDAGRRVLRPHRARRPRAEPGVTVPDPYFGGAGPDAHRVHRVRQLHGRLPGRRQEHPGQELPRPGRAARRADRAAAHGGRRAPDRPARPAAGYGVTTERTGAWLRKDRRTVTARQVVLAAGTWGTQRLLHTHARRGVLPDLSPRLGAADPDQLRGARRRDDRARARRVDLTRGVAITSSFHPDDDTHVENVRYGKGSNAMGLLATLLVDGGGRVPRPVRFLGQAARHPACSLRSLSVRRWSERTVIGLVMQTRGQLDHRVGRRHRCWAGSAAPVGSPRGRATASRTRPGSRPGTRPVALAGRLSERTGCAPTRAARSATCSNVPMTAHFLGGCVIGDTPEPRRGRPVPPGAAATRACTWSTGRPSRPTSASTRR